VPLSPFARSPDTHSRSCPDSWQARTAPRLRSARCGGEEDGVLMQVQGEIKAQKCYTYHTRPNFFKRDVQPVYNRPKMGHVTARRRSRSTSRSEEEKGPNNDSIGTEYMAKILQSIF
jgi:hypothetical protein